MLKGRFDPSCFGAVCKEGLPFFLEYSLGFINIYTLKILIYRTQSVYTAAPFCWAHLLLSLAPWLLISSWADPLLHPPPLDIKTVLVIRIGQSRQIEEQTFRLLIKSVCSEPAFGRGDLLFHPLLLCPRDSTDSCTFGAKGRGEEGCWDLEKIWSVPFQHPSGLQNILSHGKRPRAGPFLMRSVCGSLEGTLLFSWRPLHYILWHT